MFQPRSTLSSLVSLAFFLLLLVNAGALLAMKLRQMSKNRQRQTPPNQSLESSYESVVVPYATYNGQGVYMSAGVPPPAANPQGAAAAGPLSLPMSIHGVSADNLVYGVNPSSGVQSVPLEGATAPASATGPPAQADSSNDK